MRCVYSSRVTASPQASSHAGFRQTRINSKLMSPFPGNLISEFQKYRLPPDPNQSYMVRHPAPLEGRSRSSRTWSGMRWTLMAPPTKAREAYGRSRVVLTSRCWSQVCDKKRRRRWQKSRSPGRARSKTIARGMPGDPGVTVVTCSCAISILHARLRVH